MIGVMRVNWEYDAAEWWAAFNQWLNELPAGDVRDVALAFDRMHEVAAKEATIRDIAFAMKRFPGWRDGPQFSRHPVMVCYVESRELAMELVNEGSILDWSLDTLD